MLILLLCSVRPAGALNQRIYPLSELIKDAECIAVGRAVAVDVPKMRAALTIDEALKGKAPCRWMALNVAPGGWGHPPAMIRRLAPGLPLIYFTAQVKGRYVVLGYTNGTWFQITAPEGGDADHMPWTFTHCEVFLRRTFWGKTSELEQVLRDVIAAKRAAPEPNQGMGAGMGDEVPQGYKPERPLPTIPEFIQEAIAAPKSGGVVRNIKVRILSAAEENWAEAAAKQFQRPPNEMAMLLAQAKYSIKDAQRALEYERNHGSGGNRAWVRSAEEILDLKQRSPRLSWLDVRGVLMRAGELFTPVTDPVDLIYGLRTKFTWDELDPMFDDDKWGRKKLAEEIPKKQAARSPHPLGPGDRLRRVLYSLDFGRPGSGELPMEAAGWKLLPGDNWDFPRRQYDWNGGESGSQRPEVIRYTAPGSQKSPLANLPPKPGIPLAANAGDYAGASLCFATGMGDYENHPRGGAGTHAYYDGEWVHVPQGESASFLIVAQVYVPDHTDDVGEPRDGWFYIRRPSRYINAGIRVVDADTRATCLTQPQQNQTREALLLKVEPALEQFDRVLLRVDVMTHKEVGKRNTEGRNEVKLIAYADGIGEVARATMDLNGARGPSGQPALDSSDAGVAFSPCFGLRRPNEGYVPEFYLASLRVQQINENTSEALKNEAPPVATQVKPIPAPTPPAKAAVLPNPKPPSIRDNGLKGPAAGPVPRAIKGPRSVVIALDTSSSIRPAWEKSKAYALDILHSLKPVERFILLNCAADIRPFAPDWTPATPDNVKKAVDWLTQQQITTGTHPDAWLQRALSFSGVNYIALVSDGENGSANPATLLEWIRGHNPGHTRIDALFVSNPPQECAAAQAARETGGITRTR